MAYQSVKKKLLVVSKFNIWPILPFIVVSSTAGAIITDNVNVPYIDGDDGRHCFQSDEVETSDVLDCLHQSGFVYAYADGPEGSATQSIVMGPQLRVASIQTAENIAYLSPDLVAKIGQVKAGEVVRPLKFQQVAKTLQERELIESSIFSFDPTPLGYTDITLHGEEPPSFLSFGVFLDGQGYGSLSLYGKHFSNYFVPGYLTYNLSLGEGFELNDAEISVPLAYAKTYTNSLGLGFHRDNTSLYRDEKVQVSWRQTFYHDEQSASLLPLSFVSLNWLEYGFNGFGLEMNSKAASVIAEFSRSLPDRHWGLRFSAFSSLTENGEWVRGDAFFHVGNSDVLGEGFRVSMDGVASFIAGEVSRIPVQERLFLGGPSSVRGVRGREIGLHRPLGANLGGDRSVILRSELAKSIPDLLPNAEIGVHFDGGVLGDERAWSEPLASSGMFFRFLNEDARKLELNVSRPVMSLDTGWRLSFSYVDLF